MLSEQFITIIVSVALFVIGWIITIYLKGRDQSAIQLREELDKKKEDDKWKQSIEGRLKDIEFPVATLWAKVQRQLVDDLHHPHVAMAEMDDLLEKLEKLDISVAETTRLKELLLARADDPNPEISDSEKASAKIMATVMDKVLEEAELAKKGIKMIKVELVGEIGAQIEKV